MIESRSFYFCVGWKYVCLNKNYSTVTSVSIKLSIFYQHQSSLMHQSNSAIPIRWIRYESRLFYIWVIGYWNRIIDINSSTGLRNIWFKSSTCHIEVKDTLNSWNYTINVYTTITTACRIGFIFTTGYCNSRLSCVIGILYINDTITYSWRVAFYS